MPVFRGGERFPTVGGPTRNRGTRSSSWVFQLPGHSIGWGWRGEEGQGGSPQPLRRKQGVRQKGQGLASARYPVMQALQSVVCPGDPETKRLKKRGVIVWGKEQGRRGPVPPRT